MGFMGTWLYYIENKPHHFKATEELFESPYCRTECYKAIVRRFMGM